MKSIAWVLTFLTGCSHITKTEPQPIAREPAQTLCGHLDAKALSTNANLFIQKNKMSKPSDPWFGVYITENRGSCFLILSELPNSADGAIEILGVNPASQEFYTIQSVFPTPRKLRVGIGSRWVVNNRQLEPNDNVYYAELRGRSALAAHKTIISGFPKSGLINGCVDAKIIDNGDQGRHRCDIRPTKPLSWDPTPNRKWRLSRAQFSLRKGKTNEVDDIYSNQLDKDFKGYLCGSMRCRTKNQSRGSVASWHSQIVFADYGQGLERVVYAQPWETPPSLEVRTHEVRFKPNVNEEKCFEDIERLGISHAGELMRSGPIIMGAKVNLIEPFSRTLPVLESHPCVDRVFPL